MATSEIIPLSEPHPPKEASIEAFLTIGPSLKRELVKLRHDHDKHEPEYFQAVKSLSNDELTSFEFPADLEEVRAGTSAYGLHLFGKVRIPASNGGYIHVRVFIGGDNDGVPGDEPVPRLHSIHTEEAVKADGDRVYRAIFTKDDALEWFDT